MSEKFLLNLLYVLAALAFWLLPALLRWLRRRREAQAGAPAPEPQARHMEPPQPRSPFDAPQDAGLEEIAGQVDALAAEARVLESTCSGPGLSQFNPLIDEMLNGPLDGLRRALQAGIADPAPADPFRLALESTRSLERLRSAAAFLSRSVSEHAQEGHAASNARGRVLARIFLARIEGLLHKGSTPPSSPLCLPVEPPSLLHPDLLAMLAATRAVPFDARAGRSPSPAHWAGIARDVSLWAYMRMPALEPEIEERTSSLLAELGYQASLPPEGLVREVFVHALPALFLGPVYARAIGPGGDAIARRMLELADADAARTDELPLLVELVLHVLERTPLEALSGSRLMDITGLRAERSDGPRTEAAAAALLDGQVPEEMEFHVVTGAMLAALDRPRAAPRVAAAADRALGLAAALDAWQDEAPVPEARRRRRAPFLSARAVREAIVVGALLER